MFPATENWLSGTTKTQKARLPVRWLMPNGIWGLTASDIKFEYVTTLDCFDGISNFWYNLGHCRYSGMLQKDDVVANVREVSQLVTTDLLHRHIFSREIRSCIEEARFTGKYRITFVKQPTLSVYYDEQSSQISSVVFEPAIELTALFAANF